MPNKIEYSMSAEAQTVGKSLIKKHREELSRLNFLFIFKRLIDTETNQDVEIRAKGKPVYADLKIVSGLNAFIAGGEAEGEPAPFPAIIISKVWWNRMDANQKRACIHQQLCRLDVSESGVPTKIEFDVQEFNEIATTYGAWNESLESFLEVTQQMKLPIKPTEAPPVSGLRAVKTTAAPAS